MGRNQDTDKPGLIEFWRAGPAYLDVGALQEQQGDEGVQILIVVTDDQRGRLSLRQGQRLRGECPFAGDRKSTRLNSSHGYISYAVFCLKKKKKKKDEDMG